MHPSNPLCPAGKAPVVQLNYTAIAAEAGVHRSLAQHLVGDLCFRLAEHLLQGSAIKVRRRAMATLPAPSQPCRDGLLAPGAAWADGCPAHRCRWSCRTWACSRPPPTGAWRWLSSRTCWTSWTSSAMWGPAAAGTGAGTGGPCAPGRAAAENVSSFARCNLCLAALAGAADALAQQAGDGREGCHPSFPCTCCIHPGSRGGGGARGAAARGLGSR
jgi:hypothetical protein